MTPYPEDDEDRDRGMTPPSVGDERRTRRIDSSLVGIGGWLVLPAIGLILSPIIGVVGLIVSIGLYPEVEAAGYGKIFALELAVAAAFLIFTIYAAIRFFGKKRNAPTVIIAMIVASLVADVLLLMIELSMDAQDFAAESAKELARSIFRAAIWIPYFKVSKRVKATFVN
jgi:uncharacterized membrane-anchored protein